jgi:hypothetical protein
MYVLIIDRRNQDENISIQFVINNGRSRLDEIHVENYKELNRI